MKNPPTPHYNVAKFGCFDAENKKNFTESFVKVLRKSINIVWGEGVEILEAALLFW